MAGVASADSRNKSRSAPTTALVEVGLRATAKLRPYQERRVRQQATLAGFSCEVARTRSGSRPTSAT